MSKVGAVASTVRESAVVIRSIPAIGVNRPYLSVLIAACLASCATTSQHQFAQPAPTWQARSGQLLYRNANTSLIGDVLVRYSNNGDFELTLWKGPGLPLLVLRQDAQFADVKGAVAGKGWTGPVNRAPKQLRAWTGLRETVLRGQNRPSLRYDNDGETFLIRFQ